MKPVKAKILTGGWPVLIIGVDQASKFWALQQGWAVMNAGVAFSWLNGQISGLMMWLITGLAGLIFWKFWPQHPVAATLILAGAISNLIDRIVWGGVIDWLSVPIFNLKNNLADWAIFVGLSWLILKEICRYRSFLKTKI